MSEGQNKRIVKKTKNADTMNIKVSTRDKDKLTKDNDINLNIDGKNKNNTNKKDSTGKKGKKEEGKKENLDIEKRITKLMEENEELEEEIYSIKSTIKSKSEEELSQILELNKNLSELEKEQINMTKENQTLLQNLKKMEEEVSKRFENKFKMSKVIQRQKMIEKENKRDLNKEIKVKEKQNINVQKFIKIYKKDLKMYDKLLEDNKKEGNEQQLNDELKGINDKINSIEKEMEGLNKIKSAHVLCKKNEDLLKMKINVLLNEIEFETKKSNMIDTEKKEPTKIKNVNMAMEYGQNVRKYLLKTTKNKYNSKIRLFNYKSYNFLLKEINDNKKRENEGSSYQKLKQKSLQTLGNADIPNFSSFLKNEISLRIDSKTPKKYLLLDEEKEILKKLLPNDYYNNINEKYNSIENEINEIEGKFKNNETIKKDINLDTVKCEGINLKLKELESRQTNLYVTYINNNKKIVNLKNKIKMLKDDIEKQDYKLSYRKKNNTLLMNNISLYKTKLLQTEE